jgi:hypothetical protein
MATTKLKAPNGASVSVDSGRVDNLLRRGFTRPSETKAPAKKATAKKAASSSTKS